MKRDWRNIKETCYDSLVENLTCNIIRSSIYSPLNCYIKLYYVMYKLKFYNLCNKLFFPGDIINIQWWAYCIFITKALNMGPKRMNKATNDRKEMVKEGKWWDRFFKFTINIIYLIHSRHIINYCKPKKVYI